ncbi:MAG: glucosaminidase domain-containing protein [Spirochaetaceae bacterium]|nr:glucosaminidase domain-containing protein [Spirochaetaceae bacterium]
MGVKQTFTVICLFLVVLCGCATVSSGDDSVKWSPAYIKQPIMGKGKKSATQLQAFFASENPRGDFARAERLAHLYIAEAMAEGVNSDVAFVQMCLETGFLQFGNLVKPEWNNFCGLGAIDKDNPGLVFETEELGVRAHIQHLKAYGSPEALVNPLVDPRYKYVNPKGKSPTVEGLAGTWAADRNYAKKLSFLLQKLSRR